MSNSAPASNAPRTISHINEVAALLAGDLNWLTQPAWLERGDNLVLTGDFGRSLLSRQISTPLRAAGKSVMRLYMTVDHQHQSPVRKRFTDGQMIEDRELVDCDLLILYVLSEEEKAADRSGMYLAERTKLGRSTIVIVDSEADPNIIESRFGGAHLTERTWHWFHVDLLQGAGLPEDQSGAQS